MKCQHSSPNTTTMGDCTNDEGDMSKFVNERTDDGDADHILTAVCYISVNTASIVPHVISVVAHQGMTVAKAREVSHRSTRLCWTETKARVEKSASFAPTPCQR